MVNKIKDTFYYKSPLMLDEDGITDRGEFSVSEGFRIG